MTADPKDRRIAGLEAEVERLRHANRTRPDYDLLCEDCGRAHILDTSLPSDIWNRIAEPHNVLCTICIDDRLGAARLSSLAKFYYAGRALNSEPYNSEAKAERDAARARLEKTSRGR